MCQTFYNFDLFLAPIYTLVKSLSCLYAGAQKMWVITGHFTLAKIELLCYKCKRSQKESARKPNRVLA